MDSQFETGTVVGKKSDTRWAQVVRTPYAFGVVEVEDEEGKAQTIGMELIRQLTAALANPIVSVQDVFSFVDTLIGPTVQTLLLCIPIGKNMTVLLRGIGVVYLKRDGHIARLRSREGTISGAIYSSDILFLSSKTCLNGVSEDELFSFFDHMSVSDSAEKLTVYLHKKQDAEGYAGLFVKVKGDEVGETFSEEKDVREADHNARLRTVPRRELRKKVQEKVLSVVRPLRTVDIRITVVLIFLFIVSIGVGITREFSGKKNTEVTQTITEGQRLYDEGIALLDLNAVKARERLESASQLVEKMKSTVSPKTKEGRMIGELEKNIQEALTQATKAYTVTPELFFDVSLLKAGGTISSFGLYEDTMALLDTQANTVFTLQLATKNGQVVAGGSAFDGSQTVAIHGDSVYVSSPEGIHVVNIQDKTVKPLVIKKATDWVSIKAMTAFGGNVYLLDTGKSRIWKYVATGSAFSDMREYLLPDFFPDLSKATNMTIDGSIWLGTTDGQVTRFTQGKEDVFVTKGVDPAFGANTFVFTDDNTENVYVLDPVNKRVVVLEKDGLYASQYMYPSAFTPQAIAVSEKLGKLFFFSEGKLYTVSLK